MKIATIMENIVDENMLNMCKIWLHQVKLSNPSEIIVLYNKNYPQFLDAEPLVKLVRCEYDKNIQKLPLSDEKRKNIIHFYISFKLYNLYKIKPPFIFLDVDAIPVHDLNELWNLKTNKPLVGCGHQGFKFLKNHFKNHGFGENTREFFNSGVMLVKDLSFMKYGVLKEIYEDYIKDEKFHNVIADDTLMNIFFKKNKYNFLEKDIHNGWNCFPKSIIKINEISERIQIIAKDEDGIFEDAKIIHYYGPSNKPWQINCKFYNALRQKLNLKNNFKKTNFSVDYKDKIVSFYKDFPEINSFVFKAHEDYAFTSLPQGLGDSAVLTDLIYASKGKTKVLSPSVHFYHLTKNNEYLNLNNSSCFFYNSNDIVRFKNCGMAGHYIQRLRNINGLKVDSKPKPHLSINKKTFNIKKRIAIHLTPSFQMNEHQKQTFCEIGRDLKPENINVIQKFINTYCREYDFYIIGKEFIFENAENVLPDNAQLLSLFLSSCEYFIGIDSGPMHIAAALELKSIIICSHVEIHDIVLPNLKNPKARDVEWLYPQNVHLHQYGENDFVKYFDFYNLEKAFNGELYPFFTDEYLDLIQDYIIKP